MDSDTSVGDASSAVTETMRVSSADAARVLVEALGLRVISVWQAVGGRCACMHDDCSRVGKHPIGADWQARATSSVEGVEALWRSRPDASVGVVTGDGLVVLDVDGVEGEASLGALVAGSGALPETVEAVTARGRHLYYRAPRGVRVPCSVGSLARGLDVRGDGGYVVAPPSSHESGKRYAWRVGHSPADLGVAELPSWLLALVAERPRPTPSASTSVPLPPAYVGGATREARYARAGLDHECAAIRGAVEGQRNSTLNRAAFSIGTLVAGGALDAAEAKRALHDAAVGNGLGEVEVMRTIASAFAGAAKADTRSGPSRELPRPNGAGGALAGGSAAPTNGASAGSSVPSAALGASSSAQPTPSRMVPRYNTASIFGPLPAQRWAVPGLQLGPGRPTLIAGYGASAKTISVQSLALSLAAGRPVWDRFACSPMVVLHIDYEQGHLATAKRYQRLALGHGISVGELGNRLHYVEMPRVYLDERDADEQWLRACDGVDLVVIDALRGAAPHSDENDSSFRAVLDRLTYVSQRTGASFVVLHHASKPKADRGGAPVDARTLARGSGAIFDASGCVYNVTPRDDSSARLVSQVKTPAEAEGAALDPFELVVSDVAVEGDARGGVRVSWREPVVVDELERADALYERQAAQLMRAVRREAGGQSGNQIVTRCGIARSRALAVLRTMVEQGRLACVDGPNKTKLYRVASEGQP